MSESYGEKLDVVLAELQLACENAKASNLKQHAHAFMSLKDGLELSVPCMTFLRISTTSVVIRESMTVKQTSVATIRRAHVGARLASLQTYLKVTEALSEIICVALLIGDVHC